MNSSGDQMERQYFRYHILNKIVYFLCYIESGYLHNFVYPSPAQPASFNGNGTVYFAQPPPPMNNGPPSTQSPQTHFHQYHPTRTFENSTRQEFSHLPHYPFQLPPPFPQPSTPLSSTSNVHQQQENPSGDLPPRFRRLKTPDYENRIPQQRPMSGDFDRLHNSSSRFNNDNLFQSRPQSFYDFSSHQQPNNNNNNNNSFRSTNNNRYQRNNNNSLPLSAYINTDESSNQNENNNNNYWGGTSYQTRRRPIQQQQQQQQQQPQRAYHQDKHQFPLSSYDPRQYGFNNNYQRRNNFDNRANLNRRNVNNNRQNGINDSNDIDLIEEWWEDDNTELIGTNQSTINIDTKTTLKTIDDSGNSSLSTSMNLKESILDDEENNLSTNDFVNPPSDISTTDSKNIFVTKHFFFSTIFFKVILLNHLINFNKNLN
jgi:hypothetical protein